MAATPAIPGCAPPATRPDPGAGLPVLDEAPTTPQVAETLDDVSVAIANGDHACGEIGMRGAPGPFGVEEVLWSARLAC